MFKDFKNFTPKYHLLWTTTFYKKFSPSRDQLKIQQPNLAQQFSQLHKLSILDFKPNFGWFELHKQ